MCLKILIFIIFISFSGTHGLNNKYFPKDFLFGISTNAFQTEGAWSEDGKGEHVWDHVCHTQPDYVLDGSNGDITSDCYHKVDEDIRNMKYLGVDFYRFSVAWSRILPTGFSNEVNDKGIAYYDNLINKLIQNEIEPVITIHHSDIPQPLQLLGGWTNSEIVPLYTDYAKILFEKFGDRVRYWTTFNDGLTCVAPGLNDSPSSQGIAEYLCIHNVLKGHASVYHLYNNTYKATQKGKISTIIYALTWYEPGSNNNEDIIAAERALQYQIGMQAHPIVFGDYPAIVKDRVAERSKMEGFPRSRLPAFTSEEINFIKGTYDYLAINHYTTAYVLNDEEAEIGRPSMFKDKRFKTFQNESWPQAASPWLRHYPEGFRRVLVWMKKEYNNPEIFVTECGTSDNGTTDDQFRTSYYQDYLSALLDAIYEDEVNISGFTAWSLVDNFEWEKGFTEKFGLYHVDFNSSARTRTAKESTKYYKKVLETRCLVDECVDYNN